MSLLEGFRFTAGTSAIHRLDPRVKLFMSLFILVIAAVYFEILPLAVLLLLQIPLAVSARVLRRWLKTLKASLFLSTFVFAINIVVYYLQGTYSLSPTDVALALSFAFRVVVFFSSFSIFFLTTTPDEIAMTLTSWKVPYAYTFAFITAIRFVPVLAEELQSIIDAQKSRGLELEGGRITNRVRKMIPVLVPLFINVIRRAMELAEAMEVKCFGVSKKRTYLRELEMRARDYVFLVAVFLLFFVGIYYKLVGTVPFFVGF